MYIRTGQSYKGYFLYHIECLWYFCRMFSILLYFQRKISWFNSNFVEVLILCDYLSASSAFCECSLPFKNPRKLNTIFPEISTTKDSRPVKNKTFFIPKFFSTLLSGSLSYVNGNLWIYWSLWFLPGKCLQATSW